MFGDEQCALHDSAAGQVVRVAGGKMAWGSAEVSVDTCEAVSVVGGLLSEAILWLIKVATGLRRALSC